MMIRKQSLLPSERFVFGFIMAVLFFMIPFVCTFNFLRNLARKKCDKNIALFCVNY